MGVGAGLCMYDVVVKTFTFAVSSTDEFLCLQQVDRDAELRMVLLRQLRPVKPGNNTWDCFPLPRSLLLFRSSSLRQPSPEIKNPQSRDCDLWRQSE